jgi:lambda repressor-like predicted transcriptional regulator
MAKKKTKWVQAADLHEGALTAKAKAEGKTIAQYCAQSDLSSKSQKQCVLAKTFAKMRKG